MKKILPVFLLSLLGFSALGQQIDFAPVGATWSYYSTFWGQNGIWQDFSSVKDTVISERVCRKVVRMSPDYDTHYFHTDTVHERVYLYEPRLDSFLLYMDFSLQPGDTLKKQMYTGGSCTIRTVQMIIDTTVTVTLFGQTHKIVLGTALEDESEPCLLFTWDDISFISEPSCATQIDLANINAYQPYYSSLFGYPGYLLPMLTSTEIQSILAKYSEGDSIWETDCEIIFTSRENRIDNNFQIAYNPLNKQITVRNLENTIIHSVEIMDYTGRTLLKKDRLGNPNNVHLDCIHFSSGIYLVKINEAYKKIYLY